MLCMLIHMSYTAYIYIHDISIYTARNVICCLEIVTFPASLVCGKGLWSLISIGSTIVRLHRLLEHATFGSLRRLPIGVAVIFRCVYGVAIVMVSQGAIKLLPLSGVLHIYDSCMKKRLSVYSCVI